MKTLLAIVALVSSMSAFAQDESTTKTKQTDVMKGQAQPKSQSDIDNEITNAKMRAESGSKSKHSFSLEAAYNGGSLEDAFGKTRPNIAEGGLTETKTALSGDVSYRYRMTPNDSITAGFGIKWLTPSYDGQKTEASNPGVGYSRAYKVSGIQNISSLSLTKYTAKQLIDSQKANFSAGVGQTALVDLGTSGWQLGLAVDASYNNYTEYVEGKQAEYGVGLYPFAEYVFNDTYNFRTVYRGNTYESPRENPMAFEQLEPTQSMGVGIAATRDIFLYPNVQWVWRDVRSEKTNVALSATMNFL